MSSEVPEGVTVSSPNHSSGESSTDKKFYSFLKLPLELRNLVYHYALIHPDGTRDGQANDNCYFYPSRLSRYDITQYWGTEASTRLFRVNRQISTEAIHLLYTTFIFNFIPYLFNEGVSALDARLCWLGAEKRHLIRKVAFVMMYHVDCTSDNISVEIFWRRWIETVMRHLPNMERVRFYIDFTGHNFNDSDIEQVVSRIMRRASPLQGIPCHLTLVCNGEKTKPLGRIMMNLAERLGATTLRMDTGEDAESYRSERIVLPKHVKT